MHNILDMYNVQLTNAFGLRVFRMHYYLEIAVKCDDAIKTDLGEIRLRN